MLRAACALVAVIATTASMIAYFALFHDEMDPRHPANLRAGLLAPMFRHWMEFAIIGWTTLPAAAIGFYLLVGTKDITINWPVVRRHFFRLHIASGGIILAGLSISLVNGQPIQLRDSITALVGIGILALGICERVWHSQAS